MGKELAEVSFVDLYNKGNGAIMAKFEKSFGEYKMPMGVECMAVRKVESLRFGKRSVLGRSDYL